MPTYSYPDCTKCGCPLSRPTHKPIQCDVCFTVERMEKARAAEPKYCFVCDNDGHWYLIPADKRDAFDAWLEEGERTGDYPELGYAKRLNRHISNYSFRDCEESR